MNDKRIGSHRLAHLTHTVFFMHCVWFIMVYMVINLSNFHCLIMVIIHFNTFSIWTTIGQWKSMYDTELERLRGWAHFFRIGKFKLYEIKQTERKKKLCFSGEKAMKKRHTSFNNRKRCLLLLFLMFEWWWCNKLSFYSLFVGQTTQLYTRALL